jgi:curli biogenesis system outer membrane secretion channel CsgG
VIRSIASALLALALLLGAAGCASAPVAPAGSPGGASGPMVVAVWDIDDLSPGATGRSDAGDLLAARVIETFQKREGIEIVERQRLEMALSELKLGSSDLADESTRLRLGRISGARFMVFGGYMAIGGKMRIDLRLVDVETGKVRKAASRTAEGSELSESWLDAAGSAAEALR